MNVNLIKSRMKGVIHTTALENTNYDFMATHVPFKKLKYQTKGILNPLEDLLSENDFLQHNIFGSRDQHKLVVVQGHNGTGKSHLIRWLYHSYIREIDENEELIILISRDENNLKTALRQIVESNIFDRIEKGTEFKKLIDASNTLGKIEVKEQFVGLLGAIIQTDDDEGEILPKRVKRNLYSFLTDEVIRDELLFAKNGPIERICAKLISPDTKVNMELEPKFYAEDLDIKFGSSIMKSMLRGETASSNRARELAERIANEGSKQETKLKSNISRYLNQHIDKVIQSIIKIGQGDLIEIFKEVRTSLKNNNMNLALFIEDITSFAGINKELMETLLIDHNTDNNLCRLISFVGITTSDYKDSLPENIKDRISERIEIGDESLFGTPGDVAGLVARYMNAILQPDDIIKKWYGDGAKLEDLPITPVNLEKKWSVFEIFENKNVSLFPFNETALWKIFGSIEKDNRTPRNLINTILLNIFSNYLNNKDKMPPPDESFGNIDLPKWEDDIYEDLVQKQVPGIKGKRISTLIRIWGDGTLNEEVDPVTNEKTIGGISESMFKDFGLPAIKGIGKKEDDQGETDAKKISDGPDEGTSGEIKDIKEDEKGKEGGISSKNIKDFEKYREELGEWKKGGVLTSHKMFREDVCRIFSEFINWEVEGVSPLLLKQLLTLSNVHIQGQNVQIKDGFIMERNEETYYFLLGLISWKYLGERSWDFQNSEEYVLRLTDYIIKHKGEIIELIKVPTGIIKEDWKYEEWMLLNSYYINVINGSFNDVNMAKEEIYDQLMRIDTHKSSYGYGDMWDSLIERTGKDVDFKQNQTQLIRYHNLILGDANPETTESYTIDAYSILKGIDGLVKNKWNVGNYITNNKYQGQTIQFIPYNLIKKYWLEKIDKLIFYETEKIEDLLKEIHNKVGDNLTESSIKHVNLAAKRFLEEGLNSINHNFDQNEFQYLIGSEDKSNDIYKSYLQCVDLLEMDPNKRLLILSQMVKDDLVLYNESLNSLNSKIDSTYQIVSNQMDDYEDDLVQDLDDLKQDLESIVEQIKSDIIDLTGAN